MILTKKKKRVQSAQVHGLPATVQPKRNAGSTCRRAIIKIQAHGAAPSIDSTKWEGHVKTRRGCAGSCAYTHGVHVNGPWWWAFFEGWRTWTRPTTEHAAVRGRSEKKLKYRGHNITYITSMQYDVRYGVL